MISGRRIEILQFQNHKTNLLVAILTNNKSSIETGSYADRCITGPLQSQMIRVHFQQFERLRSC
jgi:hypothetical protein